ncbi:TolC family protein [Dapis sp. BLCC M126]|uniref:TolC family protein n=1 Tax=Dapis sp. BLCC M126 TaxID=3400189 RepID=UPI003CEBA304
MSVFRNIVVVGVIGAVISNAGQGSSAPLPMHSQSNTPENSILDPGEVKEKSVEVKETQGVKSDINSLEKVTQLRPQGSLLEKLKLNSFGTKVPSNRNSEVNINKQLPESKANKEIISALKKLENIYKNTGSLLVELKSHRKEENISPSDLQFKQSINPSFAANKNQKFRTESKILSELGKSDGSLLDLLESKSENSQVETEINPPVETSFKQSIILGDKDSQKFNPDSKKLADLSNKSNSSLLNLLESKSENSQVETKINPPIETSFKQSIILGDKDSEKFNPDSKKLADLSNKSNSSLLNLLESKSENSQIETQINPPVETSFKQSIILGDKDSEKFNPDSKKLADLSNKSNSSLLNLLESKSENSQIETQINPPVETSFKQSIILGDKDSEKFNPDSKKLADLSNKSNSSLLNLLESKSENSQIETQINPPVETSFKQSIILGDKDSEKFNSDSKKLADIGKSNSSLLNLLESKSETENHQIETAKIQTNLKSSTPENQNQKNERNPILGNSYQVMTSINRAPTMATINDLSQIETQASVLNNPQKRNNYPIRLPGRTNQSIVSTIQRPPTFGNTSKQQNSVQIMTGLNPTSTMNTVPNLARVENQKHSSNNSSLIIAQQNSESFPPPVPNGTLQTNPPPQIEPNSNPLNFPISPDEVQIKETIPITLEQAIDLARRNNPEIQVSQLEVERTKASLREAQAALWPSLTFDSTIQRTESAIGDLQGKANQRRAESLGQEVQDTDIQNFPTTTFDNIFQFDYDLGLGKARSSRIGVAREQMRLQELELERVSEQLRLDVSDDYYNLQQADGRVRIGEAAVKNARKSLEDAEALERAGVGTRFDVLQAQVTLSNEQQNLTNALRDQRTSQRRLAERLSANELINLTAADPIEPAGSWLLSLDETIVAAFQNRAELEQQLVQRDLSDEQRKLALSAVRPNLNFFATYNVLALTTENQDFRAARGWADGSTIGLRFRWNFFDGGAARAAARQSIIDGQIAETRFEQVRNQIRREVEESFFGLEASFENISTAELGVEQAKEALRLARLRFQAGVGTQLEVIQQETDLTRAEDNLLTAIIDYNRSLSELQRSVSNLPGENLSAAP